MCFNINSLALRYNKLLLSRCALGLPTLRFGSPKARRYAHTETTRLRS